jgi:hypothetical protein
MFPSAQPDLHLISPLNPNEADMLGHGQQYVLGSAEETINGFKTSQIKGVWSKQ